MPFPPYSTRLFVGTVSTANAWVTVYTVPGDKTLILRRVTVHNTGGATGDISLGQPGGVTMLKSSGVLSVGVVDTETWLVFPAGQGIGIYASTQPWNVSLHGQLLELVP